MILITIKNYIDQLLLESLMIFILGSVLQSCIFYQQLQNCREIVNSILRKIELYLTLTTDPVHSDLMSLE